MACPVEMQSNGTCDAGTCAFWPCIGSGARCPKLHHVPRLALFAKSTLRSQSTGMYLRRRCSGGLFISGLFLHATLLHHPQLRVGCATMC